MGGRAPIASSSCAGAIPALRIKVNPCLERLGKHEVVWWLYTKLSLHLVLPFIPRLLVACLESSNTCQKLLKLASRSPHCFFLYVTIRPKFFRPIQKYLPPVIYHFHHFLQFKAPWITIKSGVGKCPFLGILNITFRYLLTLLYRRVMSNWDIYRPL